jgi:hypothetical protein
VKWCVLVLVAVIACRSEDKPAPKPAAEPTPNAESVHAQLIGCAPAMPLPIDPRDLRTPRRAPTRLTHEWTPFALLPVVADETVSTPAAAEMTDAIRERLSVVDNCFKNTDGVVRAMLAIDTTGAMQPVRAGGLGDAAVERCVALALDGLKIRPPTQSVELACDFARGRPDAPLRVSPDGGYTVVQVSANEVRVDGATHALPARQRITSLGVKSTVLVVADPDATPEGLDFALWWAPPTSTIVAIKAAGGAPVFAGMGDSRADRVKTDKRVLQLQTDNGRMRVCLAAAELGDAALVDFRAMDAVMAKSRAACDTQGCEPTIVIGTRGTFVAKDLVATTSAARRAGFSMISIGGAACD